MTIRVPAGVHRVQAVTTRWEKTRWDLADHAGVIAVVVGDPSLVTRWSRAHDGDGPLSFTVRGSGCVVDEARHRRLEARFHGPDGLEWLRQEHYLRLEGLFEIDPDPQDRLGVGFNTRAIGPAVLYEGLDASGGVVAVLAELGTAPPLTSHVP